MSCSPILATMSYISYIHISPYLLYILYWPVVLPGCWPIDPLVLFLPADRRDPIWSQFAQRLERSKARQHWSVLLIYWSGSLHEKAADQNDNFVDEDAIILQNQNIVLDHKDVSKSQSYAIEKGFEYLDGSFLPLWFDYNWWAALLLTNASEDPSCQSMPVGRDGTRNGGRTNFQSIRQTIKVRAAKTCLHLWRRACVRVIIWESNPQWVFIDNLSALPIRTVHYIIRIIKYTNN